MLRKISNHINLIELLKKIKMLQKEFQKIRLIKFLLIKNILRMLIIYLIGFLDNEKSKKLYEGKAKIIYATSDKNLVIQHFKDDATAFNNKKEKRLMEKVF